MITLITGATSGIGEQLAIKYAQLGDTVIACGRNSEKLAEMLNTTIFKYANLTQLIYKTLKSRQLAFLILTVLF